jgi:hypothetical protein
MLNMSLQQWFKMVSTSIKTHHDIKVEGSCLYQQVQKVHSVPELTYFPHAFSGMCIQEY